MADDSRRRFLKGCLCLSLSGLSSALAACSGCGRKGPKASVPPKDAPSETAAFEACYLKLRRDGKLKSRGEALWKIMGECRLCPRECGADRLGGEKGFCQSTSQLMVSASHPHFGEEKSLVGTGGSGTIFMTNCSLRCVFCINWEISQEGMGHETTVSKLAAMMLRLQDEEGCHNINVVTPTHYAPHILLALDEAAGKGLRLPVVYNTCGWERLEILEKLDGVVDIYLPDFKYWDAAMAGTYSSGASEYPEMTKKAILEMNRQVGVARPAGSGLMQRGLMIRHLVMPNRVGGSKEIMAWIAENLPKNTYVNIMSQYTPVFKAEDYPDIARPITYDEYDEVVKAARKAGLTNLDIQGYPEKI